MMKSLFAKLSSSLPIKGGVGVSLFLLMGAGTVMAQTDTDPFPEVDYYKYQSNMSFTGQVRINGEVQPDGTIVAVYCGDEIRGKDVVFSQGSRSNFFMLNAMGETYGDPLHFKVYVGGRVIEVDQDVTFSADAEVGSIKSYYNIDLPAPVATTFSAEGWATTCLPFNANVPEGVTVWNATGIEEGELVMQKCAGSILPKGTPVLLEGTGSCEWLSRVADADVTTPGSIFQGTTEATEVAANSVLTLGHNDETGDIGFWRFAGTTVPANRAYIADIPTGVRGLTLKFFDEQSSKTEYGDGTATGIDECSTSLDEYNCPVTYSLDGRRFSGKPVKPGIYVKNGKKVVIK